MDTQGVHIDTIRGIVRRKKEFVNIEEVYDIIPISVTGIAFRRKYQMRSFDDLDRLGPKAALMIDKIRVCRPHAQLRHLTIVDTPGNDSCIPYHHTMSRSYIEEHTNSPVICFVDGKRAGGLSDKKNIQDLLDLSEKRDTHLNLQNRTFFLITKRDEIRAEDRSEVINKADEIIRERGWSNPSIHLVDSVAAAMDPNDLDWLTFTKAVRDFIGKYQMTYLHGITDDFKNCIEKWLDEEKKKLEELDKSEETRKEGIELRSLFKGRLSRFMGIDFTQRCKRITDDDWLYMSNSMTLEESVNEAINNLRNVDASAWWTSTKDERVNEMKEIVDDIGGNKNDWKDALIKNIRKHSNDLVLRIRNFITDVSDESEFAAIRDELRRITITERSPLPDFIPVLWEPVLSARNSSDRINSNFWGWFDTDLKSYRDRIISALREMLKKAQKVTDEEFQRICDDYRSQVQVTISTLDAMSRTALSSSTGEERKKVEATKQFFELWKGRVEGAFVA